MPAKISKVTAEHYLSPLGVETPAPRLSWQLEEGLENWSQRGCEIRVKKGSAEAETHSSESGESILVDWPSKPLASREGADVSVRAQGKDGEWTEWSSPLHVEAGLLERSDWKAQVVTSELQTEVKRPFRVRHTFTLPETKSGRLYITALGMYEAHLNGKRIGDEWFGPGWTSYQARLAYQTYDVTDLLKTGENVLAAWVGEGWYAGRLGFHGGIRDIYGNRPGLIAQLEVDGKIAASTAQGTWEWSYGALLGSEIYDGESYDSSLPDIDWSAGEWKAVERFDIPLVDLVSSQAPPVRVVDTLSVKEIITTPSGKTILDFGQNFAGVIRLESEPPQETEELLIKHAEVLENGELGIRPLRVAKATDRIIKPKKGYTPKFTFHGFRYAEVTGWKNIKPEDVIGLVLQSAMPRTGDFTCSHKLINRLHENSVWSTIANTISLPTDCPQRDERLGWTGDICVFAPTMSYLFDTAGFLGEWLKDLAHDQARQKGVVPIFVPDIGTIPPIAEAIWGDAAVLTPHDLHVAYGDRKILATQFESIKSWLSKGVKRDAQTGLWDRGMDQLADWLAPRAPPETPNMGPTDNFLVADAWLVYSTRTASHIAKTIGEEEEAVAYAQQAKDLTKAFYHEYVTGSGRIISDTQTALCLLLRYEIYPEDPTIDYRTIFSKRLEELVRKANWQVDTGFAGTPIVLQTLAETGQIEHAYRMLQAKECPSWLSCVLLGATTIWERWDSMLSDGSINPGEMTSFNHYALGSVASFMHNYIGGLSPLEPGWKQVLIRPQPGGTITSAKTSHLGPYGRISVDWRVEGEELKVDVEIPPNSTGKVVLPGVDETIGSGKKSYSLKYTQPSFPPPLHEPHFAPVRPSEWIP